MAKIKEMTEEEKRENARTELNKGGRKIQSGLKDVANDDSRYTLHYMDLMTLPPIDCRICPPDVLRMRCVEYFEMCMRDEMKPSFAGFALCLGMHRMTLINYLQGTGKVRLDNLEILQQFSNVLNALQEDYMQNGKVNPVAGIFLMKNNFGYKDQQEYVVNNAIQEESTPDELVAEANLLLETEPKKANIEELSNEE